MMARTSMRSAAVTAGLVCALGLPAAFVCAAVAFGAEGPSDTPIIVDTPATDVDVADGGWVVTDEYTGGLERYWIHADGSMARGELLRISEGGFEYYAYATPEGPVVRGRWADPETGYVYLADNDGRLEDAGWLVTGEYGDGGLQRYWVDAEERACVPGFSSEGYAHYTTAAGYVLRGTTSDGGMRSADNDGLLVTDGWVVTGDFTGGALERYWAGGDGAFAAGELVDAGDGSWAYATPEGPVVRGRWADPETGYVYLADNDGRLEDAGWLVTGEYGDGGLQRYWVDAEERACVPGFSSEGYAHYTTAAGYVLRGRLGTDNGVIIADNDGLLAESLHSTGIVDTDKYDGTETRYSFVLVDGHLYAQTGFFTADVSGGRNWCFADADGRVLRGKLLTVDGMLIADSEGALIENYHSAGMVVTDVFDGGLERYFLEDVGGHLYARTGLFSYEGDLYYGLTDEGYLARNCTISVDGTAYEADNDAKLTQIYVNRKRDVYLSEVTWTGDAGYLDEMCDYANQIGSDTDYFVTIDHGLCRIVVLQRTNGSWHVVKTFNGNLGKNNYAGIWKVEHKRVCMWNDSYAGSGANDWATCFIEAYSSTNYGKPLRYIPGKGYENCAAIHGASATRVGYDMTGCTALRTVDSKWVYDNVPVGSTVYQFN